MQYPRLTTGVPGLDSLLGGGLLPGTLTVLVGATGIGKTQFGLQFAHAGSQQEGHPGIIFDMTSRGDSQSHAHYAERLFDWKLRQVEAEKHPELAGFYSPDRRPGDYLHVFSYQGRRVTRRDLEFDSWQDWKAEVVAKLGVSVAFFYGNFVRGVRRAVVDGVEPAKRASDSIQLELFEYVYHQILRKDPEWVARDLFRQDFRAHAAEAHAHLYDPSQIACLLLYTSHESMLDDLISRPLDEGDVLANANTIIQLGKVREAGKLARALYVSKHRGSACTDEIVPFQIDDRGVRVEL